MEAAEEVANNPEDEDAIASFRLQLKKILTAPENAVLVAQIEEILAGGKKTTNSSAKYHIEAEKSQIGAIGDDAHVTMNIGTKE